MMRALGYLSLYAAVLMLSCPLCHFPRRRRVGVVVSESMISPFSADVGVGTIEDGCLDGVVLSASLPSALSSRSL